MKYKTSKASRIAKALAAERRLLLVGWLDDPDTHFRDRVKLKGRRNAVAAHNIEQKWNVCRSTTMKHIGILKSAGLITVERKGPVHWVTRCNRGIVNAHRAGHNYVR